MKIQEVEWENPDAVQLRNEQSADLSARYDSPLTLNEPAPEGLVSFSVMHDEEGTAVGCVALVDQTGVEEVFGPGRTVEMRKVFVRPEFRGRGLSHLLVDEAHRIAVTHGFDQVVLVSGSGQPESVGLYRSRGYQELPPYGIYQQFETSLFFVYPLV